MLDVVVSNGIVVDGTGGPSRRADVGIRGGRIVAIGAITEPAARTVDAEGLVVAPGFIDVHTHHDAQALWDPTLSPSPLHGITTVIGGNCGFTVAPSIEPGDAEYLRRMLSRVEGMPLEALEAGVDWSWRTSAEFFEAVEAGGTSPNTGFLVGHSALRRSVMGEDATSRPATSDEIERMCGLLAAGLQAGGLGFSTSWSRTHSDHAGDPVPSRWAAEDETLRLCEIVRRYPGTMVQLAPGPPPFDDQRVDLMSRMSVASDRPVNWNVLFVYAHNWAMAEAQLRASDRAAEQGGCVLALTLPDSLRMALSFDTGVTLDLLPGWEELFHLTPDERVGILGDPNRCDEWDVRAQQAPEALLWIADWARHTVVYSTDVAMVGRQIGAIAAERGTSAWATLADIVARDRLETVVVTADRGDDDETWARRVQAWRDPRTIVGGSDAGAHIDQIDSFTFSTRMLSEAVRTRGLLPLEEAISFLTGRAADAFGLVERGVISEGAWADLVIFDPTTIAPRPIVTRHDLPAGPGRLYGGADGIRRVIVGGIDIVVDGELTHARPGRLLRSGIDTRTVERASIGVLAGRSA